MGIPKTVEVMDDIDIENMSASELVQHKNKSFQSRRGAKAASTPKPKGSIRVTTEGIIKTNRPKLVYKERVVDSESGQTGWVLWWLTEKSEYHGIEELVQFNPRTEEEIHKGFDYTVPFTLETAKKLIEESFGGTQFYIKDGVPTYNIKSEDLNEVFLKDYLPGLTPKH